MWYTVNIHYTYPDGNLGVVIKDAYGKKAVAVEVDYISQWLVSHGRTVTSVEITEAEGK